MYVGLGWCVVNEVSRWLAQVISACHSAHNVHVHLSGKLLSKSVNISNNIYPDNV